MKVHVTLGLGMRLTTIVSYSGLLHADFVHVHVHVHVSGETLPSTACLTAANKYSSTCKCMYMYAYSLFFFVLFLAAKKRTGRFGEC